MYLVNLLCMAALLHMSILCCCKLSKHSAGGTGLKAQSLLRLFSLDSSGRLTTFISVRDLSIKNYSLKEFKNFAISLQFRDWKNVDIERNNSIFVKPKNTETEKHFSSSKLNNII